MPPDDPDRKNEQLGAIVGDWVTHGHVVGDPPVPVMGSDVYDLLPGGHFLVHHVDVTVGDEEVKAIEVIGEPSGRPGTVLARSYDNAGNAEVMELSIDDDGVFHFAGGPEIARAAQPVDTPVARVRSTLTVAPDRSSMQALWERSDDGSTWVTWMEIGFTPRSGSRGG